MNRSIAGALVATLLCAPGYARASETPVYQGPAFMTVFPETAKCYDARTRNDDVGIVRSCITFAQRVDREIAKSSTTASTDDAPLGSNDGPARSVLGVWSAEYWYAVAQSQGRLRRYPARAETLHHIADVLARIDIDGLTTYDRENNDNTAGRYRRVAALVRDSLATLGN